MHEVHQDFTYYEKKAKGSAYCPNIAIDIKKTTEIPVHILRKSIKIWN